MATVLGSAAGSAARAAALPIAGAAAKKAAPLLVRAGRWILGALGVYQVAQVVAPGAASAAAAPFQSVAAEARTAVAVTKATILAGGVGFIVGAAYLMARTGRR